MSDNSNMGFSKLVPGFDFLQNLAKGATQSIPQMPMSNWVAPTLNVEELERRIAEMKAVQFWLDQNAKALAATVQALEVQKMTLATLKGMNMNMAEMANSLRAKTADAIAAGAERASTAADAAAGAARSARAAKASEKESESAEKDIAGKDSGEKGNAASAGVIDPLQWWGALTQQFQQIAASAMKDATARNTAVDTARTAAAGMARDAVQGATDAMHAATKTAAGKSSRAKTAPAKKARKTTARKRSTPTTK